MEVIKTAIDGVVIIEPRVFKDARGYFFESFSQREFDEKVRKVNFVQAWIALPASSIHTKQVGSLC